MAKLEKRQMIIIGVMALVILFAAYDFLSPKKKGLPVNATQKASELSTFVNDLTAGMGKDTTTSLGALVFSRAEKEWTQDPFLDSKSYKAWTQATQARAAVKEGAGTVEKKIGFVYSGYLGSGKKRMAVINGVEYKEGEALDIGGFVLNSVSPTRVVIGNRGTGATLNIPLQE
jgi:hypothetical protein